MTDAEKDVAWRSLPEVDKATYRRIYRREANAGVESYGRGYRDALVDAFGAHNLTATKEEKPFLEIKDADAELICRVGENPILSQKAPIDEPKSRFKVGDIVKVSQDMKWGNGENDKNKEILLNSPSQITEIQGEYALLEGAGESVYGLIPLKYLISYAKEQEPKNGESVDFASSSLQNEISSLSKEDAEELAKCLAAVDDFVKEYKDSQVDWLAYRMELAKAITPKVISALSDNGVSSDFCESVIDKVTTIVDGIVERLKGGKNGKV